MVISRNIKTLPCAAIQKLNFQAKKLKFKSRAKGSQAKLTNAHTDMSTQVVCRIL